MRVTAVVDELRKLLSDKDANKCNGASRRIIRVFIPKYSVNFFHEQLCCWCLNFHGRITVASVKNFQVVAASCNGGGGGGTWLSSERQSKRIILQFGKVRICSRWIMDTLSHLSRLLSFA
ncbi:unnamed protein product [Microthlaspi erraticum]|uniref:Tubby C-terminal domain-containing protein n=1 Tax=Microthlaspi erraticum TaxID=1685480 RepID=A0A6D2KM72_9BRAS|nr:unnamed protein product [Microthlaspi erraticum]